MKQLIIKRILETLSPVQVYNMIITLLLMLSNCSESLNSSSYTDINNDESLDNESSLKDKLAKWAIKRHISHFALTDLLHILSTYHPELPLHSRTLLQIATTTVIIKLEIGELL